jgi:hypothetical protein
MPPRDVRTVCEQRLRELTLPEPFSLERLRQALQFERGRPLFIRPWPATRPSDAPLAIWVASDQADMILYAPDVTPTHREHIILHEIAHILLDHKLSDDEDATRVLLPDLDPAVVHRILGRTSFDSRQEQEAELLATMIVQEVRRRIAMTGVATSGMLRRLADTFAPVRERGGD